MPSEYDDRQVADLGDVAHALEDVEASHVGQTQVEHDAVERFSRDRFERFGSRDDDGDIDIVVAKQFANTDLFRGIIFHDQQSLAPRGGIILDARNG